jgi:hypothetical protein
MAQFIFALRPRSAASDRWFYAAATVTSVYIRIDWFAYDELGLEGYDEVLVNAAGRGDPLAPS